MTVVWKITTYFFRKIDLLYTFAKQTIQQLGEGKELYEIEVKLRLTMLKLLHVQWLTDLHNLMTRAERKNIVLKGWKSAGITKSIQ